MYYVYVLQCQDGALYTGVTRNVQARLERHVSGRGSKFVRSRGAAKVVYVERKRTLATAMRREAEIKTWSREKKLELVARMPL